MEPLVNTLVIASAKSGAADRNGHLRLASSLPEAELYSEAPVLLWPKPLILSTAGPDKNGMSSSTPSLIWLPGL